ncbi:cell division protein FtsN [Rahnella sp. SAP-1]|uniref:Cell division protein FtsN n=1 Tax=Rouxiella aceris TaxID=2703884 RepID=A0A848MQX7_9GAMM|nr:cell division protein FtsN [Rouxiella aceris]NMP29469.1 cell division protein FtsN [Rouxiella aceris]
MAQKDYVSRGRSGARRKKSTSRKKSSSPMIPKTMVVFAVAVVVVFIGGLYFITHNKSEEAQILPAHAPRPGNGLPPKPAERWRYIKELENRQMGVQTPTEPTSGGDVSSKTQLTPEQRQLLEQMQADMRQTPTQLSEVPYNDPTQVSRTQAAKQQSSQPTFMQQPVRAPQPQPTPTQPRPRPVQVAPQATITQSKPVVTQPKPVVVQPKPVVTQPRAMITQAKPEHIKPQQPASVQAAPAAAPAVIAEKPAEKPKEAEKPKDQPKSQRFLLQCGSFHGTDQAESYRAKLAFEGFEGRVTTSGGWNRVVIGPYNNRAGADGTLSRLKNSGITGCIPLPVGG